MGADGRRRRPGRAAPRAGPGRRSTASCSDAVALVGADGSPLIQGRSLIYRFAAAAPFWVGAIAGVPSVSLGRLRGAATRIVRHFVDHGAPDERGLLTLGWHGPWPRLAQSYSGPGSPYWASKGMLGIALPADHPVWTAPEEPLPVRGAATRCGPIRAPGWWSSGTRADGIVRVVNHGTDHAVEGATVADSPLYARLGYSTATSPGARRQRLGRARSTSPSLLVDDARPGHPPRRDAPARPCTSTTDGVGRGRVDAPSPTGSTRSRASATTAAAAPGRSRPAGHLTVYSLVRGPWELRLTRVDDLADGVEAAALRLRIGGWAVAGGCDGHHRRRRGGRDRRRPDQPARQRARRRNGRCHRRSATAGPLAGGLVVPWLDHPVRPGAGSPPSSELSRAPVATAGQACQAVVDEDGRGLHLAVDWPDGVSTSTRLDTEHARPTAGVLVAVRARPGP